MGDDSTTCPDARESRKGAPYKWSCQACRNRERAANATTLTTTTTTTITTNVTTTTTTAAATTTTKTIGTRLPPSDCTSKGKKIISLLNAYRAEHGLPSIPKSCALCTVANEK